MSAREGATMTIRNVEPVVGRSTVPIISVMMLVYNTRRFVEAAARSILNQSFGDFELIVIDDGSTDGSTAILRRLAEEDRRIRLVSRKNCGITASRNEAVSLARGRFVAIMDSDDLAHPERLARQSAYLDAHPECVLVCSQMQLIDVGGRPIRKINLAATHEEIDAANLGHDAFFVGVSGMIRREALVRVGGFREAFPLAEDRDLYLRLAEVGRLASLAEPLYLYRQHVGSICRSRPEQLSECIERAVSEARSRRGLAGAAPSTPKPYRRQTPAEVHRTWAWWALEAGNIGTARWHATQALARSPLNRESWRTWLCAIRGR